MTRTDTTTVLPILLLISCIALITGCQTPQRITPEDAHSRVMAILESSLENRGGCTIRGGFTDFEEPLSRKDVRYLQAVPGYENSLKSILIELVEEEARKCKEVEPGRMDMIAHVCEIMVEFGDEAFLDALETARKKARSTATLGASSRAIRRIQQGK